ncbi:hypothetical protein C0991_008373 [Blastosporella zonata]|nr:hypothetical protein C0991_008373 [Blastosporella zonata]
MNNLTHPASLSGPTLLPTEIMSKIFLQCTDVDGSLTPPNTIDVPLLLTKICRSWRTVAIGTRSLWSRLYLNIKPNAKHQATLLSTWLTRSGTCPLHIYIMWNDPPYFPSHAILDILVQHSHHWGSMYFFLPLSAYTALFPARGNFPSLTELSLGTHEPSAPDPILDAFEDAPKLRSLECVNLHPYMFKFPWANLSEIPIMTVTVDDSLDILRRAPRLERGSFIYTDELIVCPAPPPKPLRHEHLKELAVLAPIWYEDIKTKDLFKYLIAPHLHSLRICNIHWPFGTHLSSFLTQIDALESLYIRKTTLTEAEVLGLLQLLPTLKHLTLLSSSMFPMVSDLLLTRLTWRPAMKMPLVPKLETLEISLPGPLTIPFVELLESRWDVDDGSTSVVQLLQVEVGASDEYDDEIIRRLESLAQAGMQVIIGTTDVPLEDGLEYLSAR